MTDNENETPAAEAEDAKAGENQETQQSGQDGQDSAGQDSTGQDTAGQENQDNAEQGSGAEPQPPSPEEELAALKKELANEKERYLRLDAEYYNYRTRSVKEKAEAYENASADAVTEILSVVDNFERALSVECSDSSFKKGVEMIFNQYVKILDKLGVTEIDALGKPFDPNFHNAVNQIEDESLGENTVAVVLQKGYMLGKRVLRHAMVTVANP